jgi:hypothetical protein
MSPRGKIRDIPGGRRLQRARRGPGYRADFRTAFHRELTATDGAYGQSAFVGDFLSFMSGRRANTPYDPLLADA